MLVRQNEMRTHARPNQISFHRQNDPRIISVPYWLEGGHAHGCSRRYGHHIVDLAGGVCGPELFLCGAGACFRVN